MKINCKRLAKALAVLAVFCACVANAALPAGWQHEQSFDVSAPGLVKISLPVATLDTARLALEDLRLYDDAGNELPFLIEHPTPASKMIQPAKSFQVSLQPNTTIITLETGLAQPIDGVTLETPAQNFIKAVRVESATDDKSWRTITLGQPIFRQPNGAGILKVSFSPTVAKRLRLVVDDQRSQPVPFTGARIQTADAGAAPAETQPATIVERDENPGETRLTLNLGAANLDVTSVKIDTDEPLFTRSVKLAAPQVSELGVFEQVIGQGVIYRVAIQGQPTLANLSVPLAKQVGSHELVLLIQNGDSPPLPITAVQVERRPVYLTFMTRAAGKIHLLSGNRFCAAPQYDLAALGANLKGVAVTPVEFSTLADNPNYHVPEALAGLEVSGAALDVSAWKYRKPIQLASSGVQQIELALDVMAHTEESFADLRVLQGSNQVPYLVQRTSISRMITPVVTLTNDSGNPHLSRWVVKLPQSHLPLTRLTCTTSAPLFQRNMSLSEESTDERGNTFYRQLSSVTWTQTPEHKSKEFSLSLDGVVQGDTLILQTENGDNPPIELEKFAAFYPATRVLFKAKPDDKLFLYYGNPRVSPPSYDLNLVARELLAADKTPATLGNEEQLIKSSWMENQKPGTGGVLFWGILAVVVLGLLFVITRLLPKTPAA